MSAAHVSVYLETGGEEQLVRTCGGNRSEIRTLAKEYENMSREEFLRRHPRFLDTCPTDFRLKTILCTKRH